MKRRGILLLMLLLSAGTAMAAMYKWVDEQGNVHYGDCPPPESESQSIEREPPPSDEEVQRQRDRWHMIIEQQRENDDARARVKEFERRREAAERAALEKQCKVLRSRLRVLRQPGSLTIVDGRGNVIRPSDEARAQAIARIEKFVRENCE